MKREIKFRAWHNQEKLMCKIDVLTTKGAFLLGVKNGPDELTDGGKMIVISPKNGRFCMNEDIEIMQFTGLLDKNGKEIYEGDMVDISEFGGVSIWRIQITDIQKIPYEHMGSNMDYIEVIGNIYENPELLNQ